ncbi:MAG: hypothetical protein EP338_03115 [Bacteroidetes bacterium]|nr:MAG: hypothetical protein EP338_03115 [Bacteroidota bacterium]
MTRDELITLKSKVQDCQKKSNNCHALVDQLERDVLEYLRQSDLTLNQLIEENKSFLKSEKVQANVSKEDSYPFGTHAIQLSGNIHKNGFFYLSTDKIESPFFNFLAKNQYPTSFKGKIQWDGKIIIKATSRKFKLIGSRVPVQFNGKIDENGTIELSIVKSRFELFGEDYMNNLILDPFGQNNSIRQKFVENIVQVKKIVNDYIQIELV